MDGRSNTIAGWVLGGCVAALGLTIATGMVFHSERPEKMGYPIAGVAAEGGTAAVEVPIAKLLATADPAKGAEVFKKCAACHTINQGGPNGVGPNLYATVGEAIATGKGGFAFSDALKKVGGSWDFDKLNTWLTSPRKFADGTKMTFAGLGDGQDRANVIAYLNAQGSNLPLPKPADAPPASPAGDAAAKAGGSPVAPDKGAVAGTPATGAPSQDPAAAVRGEREK